MRPSKVKKKLDKIIVECASEYGTTKEAVYADEPVEDLCFYKCVFDGFGLVNEDGTLDLDGFIELLGDTKPEEVEEYKKCNEETDPCVMAKCMDDVNIKYNED